MIGQPNERSLLVMWIVSGVDDWTAKRAIIASKASAIHYRLCWFHSSSPISSAWSQTIEFRFDKFLLDVVFTFGFSQCEWTLRLVYPNHRTCVFVWLLPPATKLWRGNVFTPVWHSVHRGVCHTHLGRHPPGHTLPRADTPQGRHPPRQTPPRETPTPPAQCMLGYGQQAGGTHLTGMQSCLFM